MGLVEPRAPTSERDALAAVGRVLGAVNGAAFELQPLLDRIAAEAAALCHSDLGFVFMLEGELIHFVAGVGGSPEHWDYERANPFPVSRETVAGRVILANGPVHIHEEHDRLGFLLSRTVEGAGLDAPVVTTFEPDKNRNLHVVHRPRGATETAAFDARNRLLSTTRAGGVFSSVIHRTWDGNGNLVSVSSPRDAAVLTTTARVRPTVNVHRTPP